MTNFEWEDFQNDPNYELNRNIFHEEQPLDKRRFFEKLQRPGFVYVLSNPSFHDEEGKALLKIGRTKNHPEERAAKLGYGTGQPTKNTLEFAAWFYDHETAEQYIHWRLDEFRVEPDREWFSCSLGLAVREISFAAMNIDEWAYTNLFYEEYLDMAQTKIFQNMLMEIRKDDEFKLDGYPTHDAEKTLFIMARLLENLTVEELRPAIGRFIDKQRASASAEGKTFDPEISLFGPVESQVINKSQDTHEEIQ